MRKAGCVLMSRNSDDLAIVGKMLFRFSAELTEEMKKVVNSIAKDTAASLRSATPRSKKPRWKAHLKDTWTNEMKGISAVVHGGSEGKRVHILGKPHAVGAPHGAQIKAGKLTHVDALFPFDAIKQKGFARLKREAETAIKKAGDRVTR